MKKIITLMLCLILTSTLFFTACGNAANSPEDKALNMVKKYMTAMEQNDSATMLECYDPTIQKTSKGLTNALGNLLGIGDAYDLGASANGFFAGAMKDAMGLSLKFDFDKVLDRSFEKNNGHINVQYTLADTYEGQNAGAQISMNFNMVKNKEDWYIKSVDEAILTSEVKLIGGAASKQQGAQVKETQVKYIDGRDFSDGVAWARTSEGWNCIDKTGKILSTLKNGDSPISDFGQGVALIKRQDGTQEMIDKTGKVISTPKSGDYDIIKEFNNDLGMIIVSKRIDTFEKTEDQTGIINNKGEWQTKLTPKIGNIFIKYIGDGIYMREEMIGYKVLTFYNVFTNATVKIDARTYGCAPLNISDGYGIFKIEGIVSSINDKFETKEILKVPQSVRIGKYQDGLYYYFDGGNMYSGSSEDDTAGFYDIEGKKVIDMLKYNIDTKVEDIVFSNGYCLLSLKNEQRSVFYTIFDKTGKMMFEPRKGTPSGKLSCGLVKVPSENGFSYINTSGERVIEIPKENISRLSDFREDAACVKTSKETYYIDKTGKRLF